MGKITLQGNSLTVQQFEYLYNSTGWPVFSQRQIINSLNNDKYHVSAWLDSEIVGMGRLLSDSSIYWYIQNIIVLPEFQSRGIGTAIMENLLSFIRNNSCPHSHIVVGLMCSEHTAPFYQKFSFNIRPCNDLGPGATLEFDV